MKYILMVEVNCQLDQIQRTQKPRDHKQKESGKGFQMRAEHPGELENEKQKKLIYMIIKTNIYLGN